MWFHYRADTLCRYLTNCVPGLRIQYCPMETHTHTHTRLIYKGTNAHRSKRERTQRDEEKQQPWRPLSMIPSPGSCLLVSVFLFSKEVVPLSDGSKETSQSVCVGGGSDVTTNKNSAVTPRNLIRNHWFTLWIETEYLESGSSSQATDTHGPSTIQALFSPPYGSLLTFGLSPISSKMIRSSSRL